MSRCAPRNPWRMLPALTAVTGLLAMGAPPSAPAGGGHDHGSGHHDREDVARGPHGGRLLREGPLALELVIHETGVPPELRVYPFREGAPLDPAAIDLRMELRRFGGRVDEIAFRKRGDHLLGDREIEEPHSFEVHVEATFGGETRRWSYESFEGRTEIAPEAAEASGIVIEAARTATIRTTLRLPGSIVANGDRLASVGARFPGVVQAVRRGPGDRVGRGDVLAVVESNESLRAYEIRSPVAGTVLERRVARGQVVDGEDALFVVADLSSLWLDLVVPPGEVRRLRSGVPVIVITDGERRAEGRVLAVLPTASERTQTLVARAEIPNPDDTLRPGLFAMAEVVVEETEVPVAVKAGALQRFRDGTVVYRTDGRVYQATPVETGRRDGEWAEIRSGLEAGDRYVAAGSFVVKADVGKSGAAHEH